MADNIKAPSHYVDGRKYEPKDVIRDWGLNFNLGSAVKYISRAGRKGDKLEDLQKAKQFLQFEIEALTEGEDLKCIVKKIDNDELTCIDIPSDLYSRYKDIRDAIARQALREVGEKQKSDIGMSCKKAAAIGDAMAKGFEEAVEKELSKEEHEKRISAELLSRAVTRSEDPMKFEDVPESLKSRVINNIAQEVLDSQIIPPDEVRNAVIDRIVERIENDELDLMDISDDLYDECVRRRSSIANSEYRKTMDALRKYAEKGFKKVKEIDDEDIVRCYADDLLKEIVNMDTVPNEYKDRVIEYIVEMIDSGKLSFRDIPWRLFAYSMKIRNAVYKKYHGDTTFTMSDTFTFSFNFEED